MTTLSKLTLAVGIAFGSALPAQTLVADIAPGQPSSAPIMLQSVPGAVVFVATTSTGGREIWRTDGTSQGTRELSIRPGPASGVDAPNLSSLGEVAIWMGTDGTRLGVYRTDGTVAGTQFVAATPIGTQPPRWWGQVTVHRGYGYWIVTEATGNRSALYRTDGTTAGTTRIHEFTGSYMDPMPAGDRVFFLTGTNRDELWATYGAPNRTTRILGTPIGVTFRLRSSVNDKLLFTERSRPGYNRAWVVEGRSQTASRVGALINHNIIHAVPFRQGFLALASPARGDVELWALSGPALLPGLVTTLRTGSGPLPAQTFGYLIPAGPQAFLMETQTARSQLHRTDGSAAGTRLVQRFSQVTSGTPIAVGEQLLLTNTLGASGNEPILSDGTAAGTRVLVDIASGSASSSPFGYHLATHLPGGPMVLFAARTAAEGLELHALSLRTLAAPVFSKVRDGCSSAGLPMPVLGVHEVNGPPSIGNSNFQVTLTSNRRSTAAGLFFDLQIGGKTGACPTLLPAAVQTFFLTNFLGTGSILAPIPNDATLVGARVFVQGMVAQNSGALFGVIDTTPIYSIVIGR